MKNYFVYIFVFISISIYSQNRFEKDSIEAYTFIDKELKSLKSTKRVPDNIISIFDDNGRVIIFWLDNKKYSAIKAYYKGEKVKSRKVKKLKLSKEDIINIENIFKNSKILLKTSNSDCNDNVHSFNRISIKITSNNKCYYNSFFSHCKQNKYITPLLQLSFYLKQF